MRSLECGPHASTLGCAPHCVERLTIGNDWRRISRDDSNFSARCLFADSPDPSPERQVQKRPDFSQRAEKQVARLRENLLARSVAAQVMQERYQILFEDAAFQHLILRAPQRGCHIR